MSGSLMMKDDEFKGLIYRNKGTRFTFKVGDGDKVNYGAKVCIGF